VTELSIQERIAIVDLADDLQVRKQRIFKILKRLNIRPTQRREQGRGNQNVATVSAADAAAIRAEILKSSGVPVAGNSPLNGSTGLFYSDDFGFFYIIQLEPAHDPGRFKVGFTMDVEGRLQKHRCSAPFSQYLKTWPCKRVWERAAIDCVTEACDKLHTEVYRTNSLEELSIRAEQFFSLMPKLRDDVPDEQAPETPGDAG
jgi:hypothetical protein